MVAEGTKIELKNIIIGLPGIKGDGVDMDATLYFDGESDIKDVANETITFLKELAKEEAE